MEGRSAVPKGLKRSITIWALLASAMLCAGLTACGSSGKDASSNARSSLAGSTAPKTSTADTTTTPPPESHRSSGTPASSSATANSSASLGVPTGDQDGDAANDKAFDKDDSFVTTFGHAASAADRKAITSLVTRYYAAIAKDDGTTACQLLFFVITESAPETYGQTAFDATAGRGKSCGPVMSKVFKGNHAQLVAENRHLKVAAIRIEGKRAWVLLRFGPESVRRLIVYREGSSWKVGELLDTELV